jgi:hypothetical protein
MIFRLACHRSVPGYDLVVEQVIVAITGTVAVVTGGTPDVG